MELNGRGSWVEERVNEFLWLVRAVVSPNHELLLRICCSWTKLRGLNFEDKTRLIQHIKKNEESLNCSSGLKEIAKKLEETAREPGLYDYGFEMSNVREEPLKLESSLLVQDAASNTSDRPAKQHHNPIKDMASDQMDNPRPKKRRKGDQCALPSQDQILLTGASSEYQLARQNTLPNIRNDLTDFAMLLVSLGGDSIPKIILSRATEPRRFLNSDGERDTGCAPNFGLKLADKKTLQSALDDLEKDNLIEYQDTSDTYILHPTLRLYYKESMSRDTIQ